MVETLNQQITPATDFASDLAENPLWDPEHNCVYWTDITAGKMYSLDLTSGLHRLIYQGPSVEDLRSSKTAHYCSSAWMAFALEHTR